MKKLLYLSPQNVIPPIDGGKIGIYYPLKYLAQKYEVYYAYLDINYEDNSSLYKELLNVTSVRFFKNTKDDYKSIVKNIFNKIPFKMHKYYDKFFMQQLDNLIKNQNIEIVFVSHAHVAFYALKLKTLNPKLKIVLREHNIEYQLIEQYSQFENNILKKIVAIWQYYKTKKYEISLWKQFDKVFFISENDFIEAEKYIDLSDKKYQVIYDGYNVDDINSSIKREYEEGSFIFAGSLKSIQNKINFKSFIDNIWIQHIKKYTSNKIYITGNDVSVLENVFGLTMEELNKLHIFNLGFVNDIDNVIRSKQFFISPTIIGSGIRIKVLHAMSLGISVIVSTIDYEMVEYFIDMNNIIKYDSSEEFDNKISNLIKDSDLSERIGNNGYQLILDKLSWYKYLQKIEENI